MFASKGRLSFLAAMLAAGTAAAFGGSEGPAMGFSRRTVKVRPDNYTHPMVVSSEAEIAKWNNKVAKKKHDRNMRRLQLRRNLIGNLGHRSINLTGMKNSSLLKLV